MAHNNMSEHCMSKDQTIIKVVSNDGCSIITFQPRSNDLASSDDIKICYIFVLYKSNENRAFRWFWDTWVYNFHISY